MMKKLSLFSVFLFILIPSHAFGELEIFTDSNSYKKADVISLWGTSDEISTIVLLIKDPKGGVVWTENISPKKDGSFSTLIFAGAPDWPISGTYTIEIKSGSFNQQKTISYGDVIPAEPEPTQSDGGCLIATATFGTELAPQVQFLREIRDNTLMLTVSGASFMGGFNTIYYSFSPAIADLERESPIFKETVKIAITPLLSSLSLLSFVDIDSESEMLGYGIGIILLNIGMYFIVPALVIINLKKCFKLLF